MSRIPFTSRRAAGAVLTLCVLLLLGAVVLLLRGPGVEVVQVRRRDLAQKVVASGRVDVPARVQLGLATSGVISSIGVREGDRVQAGQLLVALDDREAQALVSQAEARLRQLREVDTRTGEEELLRARVTEDQATRKLRRVQALFDSQAVSREDLENSREVRDLAASEKTGAEIRARSRKPGGADEQQAVAELAAARARLANTRIMAPAAGTILSRQAEPGDAVQPGRVLLVLARDTLCILSVQPEERSLGLLRMGQAATASADAYPEARFPAHIVQIAPAVDPDRGTIEVKLEVPIPPPYLKPDMTVSVDIETARQENALILPADAVRQAGKPDAWVLALRNGRAVRLPVRTGISGDGFLEIAGGLNEGDLVIPPSETRAHPGSRVRGRLRKD